MLIVVQIIILQLLYSLIMHTFSQKKIEREEWERERERDTLIFASSVGVRMEWRAPLRTLARSHLRKAPLRYIEAHLLREKKEEKRQSQKTAYTQKWTLSRFWEL